MTLGVRRSIAAIATLGVAIGLGDMPYGYYSLLRLTVCAFCLFLLLSTEPVSTEWQRWTLGATAVLYNPLLPIRIGDKNIWIVLNIATVIFFWALVRTEAREQARR